MKIVFLFKKVILKFEHSILVPMAKLVYKNSKIKDSKIVIDNFGGRGFGDNPKYIILELLKQKTNIDIVWLVSNMKTDLPSGVRKVRFNSIKSIRELATAKIWIDNIKNTPKPLKKEEQFYLQTWHGGIGLKAVEKQIEKNLPAQYVATSKKDASQTDLMLSDSDWTTNIFSKYFWYDGEIKKTGFPRNDILVTRNDSLEKKVYDFYNIDPQKKILLYAPTFRDNGSVSAYQYDFDILIKSLERKFGGEYILLIRLHPNVRMSLNKIYNSSHIIDASKYPDMQELIIASDVLITDFSSCMFDAMIANKKVFLLANDYDEYIKSERKLLFDIKKLPFPFENNIKELSKLISKFDLEKYSRDVSSFYKQVGLFEDGKSAKRVANIVIKKMRENRHE